MAKRKLPIVENAEAKKILRELCRTHNLSVDLVISMIEIQRDNLGRGRQVGITQEFSAAIAEFLDAGKIT